MSNLQSTVFTQICNLINIDKFKTCVERYKGDNKVHDYTCYHHLLCMVFAQLTNRDSLRDIECSLMSQINKLYHMGFSRCKIISRNTISNANETRDYRIYEDYAKILIEQCKELYKNDNSNNFISELKSNFDKSIYALDSSIIRVAFSLMPWANYMDNKNGAVKLHTLMDLKGNIPTVNIITNGNVYDASIIDDLVNSDGLNPGDLVIMDRGYMDYSRLFKLEENKIFFINRAIKQYLKFKRISSNKIETKPITKEIGIKEINNKKITEQEMTEQDLEGRIIFDQIIKFTSKKSQNNYPNHLRCIKYKSNIILKNNELQKQINSKNKRPNKRAIKKEDRDGIMIILTNNFKLSADNIVKLYKERWNIEVFFKWTKQHLKIKHFYSNTENGVKIQIWSAIILYLLVCILRKKLNLESYTIYEILQILDINVFERTQINQLFKNLENKNLQKSYVFENDMLNLAE